MHAESDRPTLTLFKRSVLAWRKSYLAEKALRQQLTGEEKAAESAETSTVPAPKILKPRRFVARR